MSRGMSQSTSCRPTQTSENNKPAMKNRRGTSQSSKLIRQFSHTSPRTLLAIIRMSQAVARLNFRVQVEIADVDEALRLIKAAKSTLNDHQGPSNRDLSKTTQIYEIIRQMHQNMSGDEGDLAVAEVRQRVSSRGFTKDEIWNTIKEYSDYGVLFTTAENTRLRFVIDEGSD